MRTEQITYKQAIDFLLPRHYSGRKPQITKAFGWFDENGQLKACCTFGMPASNTLCEGICGKEFKKYVIELNRLCREDDLKEPLSKFVSECLNLIKPAVVVSYADDAMHHHGYIYQACNFIYTGKTKQRTDKWTPNGKHSRHYDNANQGGGRKVRSAKHRYVYVSADKKLKRELTQAIRYQRQPYPKGDNDKDYKLGTYLQDVVV